MIKKETISEIWKLHNFLILLKKSLMKCQEIRLSYSLDGLSADIKYLMLRSMRKNSEQFARPSGNYLLDLTLSTKKTRHLL